MPSSELWAGALSLLLIHHETGCQHSALNAARLLDRIGALDDLDAETRNPISVRRQSTKPADTSPSWNPKSLPCVLPCASRARPSAGAQPCRPATSLPSATKSLD